MRTIIENRHAGRIVRIGRYRGEDGSGGEVTVMSPGISSLSRQYSLRDLEVQEKIGKTELKQTICCWNN